MFDVIEEMHSLSNLSFEKLCEIAIKEKAPIGSRRLSKVEIITAIIAGRVVAHMDWRKDFFQRMTNKSNPRTKCRIEDQYNNNHYVELTDEQIRFMNWCDDNNIDPSNSTLYEMEDIEWEAP